MNGLRFTFRSLVLALFAVTIAATDNSIEPLPPRHTTITRQLSPQVVNHFEIYLESNQYVEIAVIKGDLHLAATVIGPRNSMATESISTQYERLHVCFISATTGKYRLELRSLETSDVPRTYHLEVISQSRASSQDVKTVAARHLLADATRLRAKWNESALRESMQTLSEAVAAWKTIGRSDQVADTLLSLGDIHFLISEYKKAEATYLEAAKTSGISASLRYLALNRAGYVNVYLSQGKKALDYIEPALNYYARVRSNPDNPREQHDEAEIRNTAGEANYSLGRLNRATKLFMRALQLWQSSGDRRGQALANLNLAYCYSDLGDLMKAQECLDGALTLSQAIGDKPGEAMALTAYGTIQSFWGQKQGALDKHREAMNILRVIGNHAGVAVALNSIGKAYEDLNEPRVALDKYHEALEIYEHLGNSEFEAVTRYYIGRVHKTLGENQNALKFFQHCLEQSQRIGHQRLTAYTLTAISSLRSAEGNGDEALQGLRKVLKLYRAMRDRRGQANALIEMGRIYEGKGNTQTALKSYREALPFTKAAGDRNAEAATLYLIALAERNQGTLEEALKQIEESTTVIESLRIQIVNPDLRASYFASVQKHSALHIDILMRLDRLHPEKHLAQRAFEINDSVRSRALLESITESSAKIRQGIDPVLLEQERILQEQLTARAAYYMSSLNAEDRDESNIAERELRELTTAYQEVQTQIRRQSPRYVNLISPEPLTLSEIQSEINDPNTLLLAYALGDERSYVWAVTADSFAAFELPARDKIEPVAEEAAKNLIARLALAEDGSSDYFERAAAADVDYSRNAATLSNMLLAPVAQLIRGKRLLIIPEGKLRYLPFDALPVPGEESERAPLVTTNEIIVLPSASLLTVIRATKQDQTSSKLVIVLADPVFEQSDARVHATEIATRPAPLPALRDSAAAVKTNFQRLLGTRQEAEEIMAVTPSGEGFVATDFNASRAITTNGRLGQFRIVHIATHGMVNTQHPELSGIVLSLVDRNGKSEDGFLQLHDIYNLDLSQTQLVVLSACRTALGKEITGEGLIGLTRGFMYGGSKSVIASLWKVDDRATTELMRHFYHAMFDEGLPPSAAMKKAKVAMWRQPRWRAPYYWAAFELQGEYRDTIKLNRTSHTLMYSAIVVAVVSLLLLGRYAKRALRSRVDGRSTSWWR